MMLLCAALGDFAGLGGSAAEFISLLGAGILEQPHHLCHAAGELFTHLCSNKDTLTLYGKRSRASDLISTALAECALNQIINARMCKRQQMRWTPHGAHLPAQVRCAVIDSDLAQQLQAYDAANAGEIAPEMSRFLNLLQRAAA